LLEPELVLEGACDHRFQQRWQDGVGGEHDEEHHEQGE
jgi:hypothetical protein